MKMGSIFKISNDFEFVATLLVGAIGHDCGCESCTITRTEALSALLWLIENHSRVNMERVEARGGGPEAVHLRLPESRKAVIPAEIMSMARKTLEEGNLTDEQRAAINGFLAGAEHDAGHP